ncbi:merozoite capping protein-1 [Beauveria brongniartii RCEF 3172]|uniref:thioredoxin-dependent peroxiredoxin n=1 Tax=Beauveria brongniartii RCEF 3172 TaxID=1081107 RepID=A0A166YAG7_9HYPO|nr:merozoite capping protein-1 [Beauveria brongniartii RCEF 3172]
MPPTLRKRKAPEPVPAPPAPKKAAAAPKKAAAAAAAAPKKTAASKKEAAPKKEDTPKKEDAPKNEAAATATAAAAAPAPTKGSKQVAVGDVVDLDDFGGEIETNDGKKTTLKKLVDESESGVVLFTYPKASTPGCTKQVCFFRDDYAPLTAGGLAIYGLSADSPKANTAFQTKQKLQYPLLCDADSTLIGAIGLKKNPRGTQRGVFVIDKAGKVLVAEAGSPQGTVDRVKALVEELDK